MDSHASLLRSLAEQTYGNLAGESERGSTMLDDNQFYENNQRRGMRHVRDAEAHMRELQELLRQGEVAEAAIRQREMWPRPQVEALRRNAQRALENIGRFNPFIFRPRQ